VAGNDDPLGAAKLGSGEDHIAVSQHIQVAIPLERLLHKVGDLGFVAADRLDIDQRSKQLDDIAVNVQRRRHERHLTASVGSGP
jgi:hypothetical protein